MNSSPKTKNKDSKINHLLQFFSFVLFTGRLWRQFSSLEGWHGYALRSRRGFLGRFRRWDHEYKADETPEHKVTLVAFWIGRN
jgi:hypothetical protein